MDQVADRVEGSTLEADEGNVIEDGADDTMLFDDDESAENDQM